MMILKVEAVQKRWSVCFDITFFSSVLIRSMKAFSMEVDRRNSQVTEKHQFNFSIVNVTAQVVLRV